MGYNKTEQFDEQATEGLFGSYRQVLKLLAVADGPKKRRERVR